jgi:hypothetical protein
MRRMAASRAGQRPFKSECEWFNRRRSQYDPLHTVERPRRQTFASVIALLRANHVDERWRRTAYRRAVAELAVRVIAPAVHCTAAAGPRWIGKGHAAGVTAARAYSLEGEAAFQPL